MPFATYGRPVAYRSCRLLTALLTPDSRDWMDTGPQWPISLALWTGFMLDCSRRAVLLSIILWDVCKLLWTLHRSRHRPAGKSPYRHHSPFLWTMFPWQHYFQPAMCWTLQDDIESRCERRVATVWWEMFTLLNWLSRQLDHVTNHATKNYPCVRSSLPALLLTWFEKNSLVITRNSGKELSM